MEVRNGIAAALTAIIAATSVACTSNAKPQERTYGLPEDLCGIEIEPSLYEPFFPPGNELEVMSLYTTKLPDGSVPPTGRCQFVVDGRTILKVRSISHWQGPTDFEDIMDSHIQGTRDRDIANSDWREWGERSQDTYELLIGPDRVVALARCHPSSLLRNITAEVEAQAGSTSEESQRLNKQLVQAFAQEIVQQQGKDCDSPAFQEY